MATGADCLPSDAPSARLPFNTIKRCIVVRFEHGRQNVAGGTVCGGSAVLALVAVVAVI